MKKIVLTFLILVMPLGASAKLKVVATLPIFASIAQDVGGDRVEVTSLARANQDPHFLDAKPTFVVRLNQADLLIHGGLELEIGWLPPIMVQARNPKVNSNTPGNVDLSQGLRILEAAQGRVDRSMGDVHPMGNPHTWYDPENVKIMANNIAQHLIAVDPQGKETYQAQLKTFVDTLNQKMAQWKQETSGFSGQKIFTYHKSLSYLTAWTRLEVEGTIEDKPGIPPSSKHVDELLMKMAPGSGVQIKAILMESFYPKKVPEYISQKTHVPLIEIPSDVGEGGTKNYFEMMDLLITKLRKEIHS